MAISPERITQLVGTDFKEIAMPIQIQIGTNPATNVGELVFTFTQFLNIDGVDHDKDLGYKGSLSREWALITALQPADVGRIDPNTGADLTEISMAGVKMILDDLFDMAFVQDATL